MNIVVGLPPNYKDIVACVGALPETCVYTYGDTIYNPDGSELDSGILAHEQTHSDAQARMGTVDWWDHWYSSVEFRVWQELDGYRAQYRDFCKKRKDRNERARYAVTLARFMSGPIYGRCITFDEAYRRIRE